MSGGEHFWIPDEEMYTKSNSPRGGSPEKRSDRAQHSRALVSGLDYTISGISYGKTSFRDSDQRLLVLDVSEGSDPNRLDRALAKLYMDVKAVTSDGRVLVSIRKGDVQRLREKLVDYACRTGENVLDLVEGFSANVGPSKCSRDVLDVGDGPVSVIVSLVPNMTDSDYEGALRIFQENVEVAGGDCHGTFWCRGQAPIVSITMPSESAVLSMCDDDAVFQVSSGGKPVPLDNFFLTGPEEGPVMPILKRPRESLPTVCVIDNGICPGCLDDLIVDIFRPSKRVEVGSHGTMVASRAAYGYVRANPTSMEPMCRLIDANVYDEFTDIMSAASLLKMIVEKYHSICKVYNLSINFSGIDVNSAMPLIQTIDALQMQYDVVFVISAGNHGLWRVPGLSLSDILEDESSEILVPAHSVLAITTGSSVMKSLVGSISRDGHVAPYSRHGPGISKGMKPDVLAHAANTSSSEGKDIYSSDAGSCAFDGRQVVSAPGTSFSAPVVSCLMSLLIRKFDRYSTLVSKALLINSVSPVLHEKRDPRYALGNGIVDMGRCLVSNSNCVTFVREGSFTEENCHRFRILVPKVLEGVRGCEIAVTCVFNPYLDGSRAGEYIGSGISISLKKPWNDASLKDVSPSESVGTRGHPYCRKEFHPRALTAGDWEVWLQASSTYRARNSVLRYALVISIRCPDVSLDIYAGVRASNRYGIVEVRAESENRVAVPSHIG